MWSLVRSLAVAATLPLIISPTFAGQLFSDWPDAIICRLKIQSEFFHASDAEAYAVFVISDVISGVKGKAINVCPLGFPNGEYSATYVRVHHHAQNANGQLIVEEDGFLEFCGPTVN